MSSESLFFVLIRLHGANNVELLESMLWFFRKNCFDWLGASASSFLKWYRTGENLCHLI